MEGVASEAASLAGHLQLGNLEAADGRIAHLRGTRHVLHRDRLAPPQCEIRDRELTRALDRRKPRRMPLGSRHSAGRRQPDEAAIDPKGAASDVTTTGSGFHDGPSIVLRSPWTTSRPQMIHAHGS